MTSNRALPTLVVAALLAFVSATATAQEPQSSEAKITMTSLTRAEVEFKVTFDQATAKMFRQQLDQDRDGKISASEREFIENYFRQQVEGQEDDGSDEDELTLDDVKWRDPSDYKVSSTGIEGDVNQNAPIVVTVKATSTLDGQPASGNTHTLRKAAEGGGDGSLTVTVRVPPGFKVQSAGAGAQKTDECTVKVAGNAALDVVMEAASGACPASGGGGKGSPGPTLVATLAGALALAAVTRRRS